MITTGVPSTSTAGDDLGKVFRWHRPLMILAATMAGLVVVGIVGMFADNRVLTGLPIWDKPTKFGLSILIYSVTWRGSSPSSTGHVASPGGPAPCRRCFSGSRW